MIGRSVSTSKLLYTLVFGLGAALAAWPDDAGADPDGSDRMARTSSSSLRHHRNRRIGSIAARSWRRSWSE